MAQSVTIWLSFSGGLLAFSSPCTFPLYPSFLSYITGASVKELQQARTATLSRRILAHSILFVLGFSVIYYVIGYSASMLGDVFYSYNELIRKLGALFLCVMGLFLLGLFQPQLLMKQFHLPFIQTKNNAFTAFLVGLIFAAGWTPCIGPIFGAIAYANAVYPGQVFVNITAYASGFGIPFIVMGFFVGKMRWMLTYSSTLMKIGGGLLVLIAILLYTDKLVYINIWFQRLTNGGWGN